MQEKEKVTNIQPGRPLHTTSDTCTTSWEPMRRRLSLSGAQQNNESRNQNDHINTMLIYSRCDEPISCLEVMSKAAMQTQT